MFCLSFQNSKSFTTLTYSYYLYTESVEYYNLSIVYIIGDGQDYNSGQYNITFVVGVSSVSFDISIIDDEILEHNESFNLGLCSLPDNVIVGNVSQATVTIMNDESK